MHIDCFGPGGLGGSAPPTEMPFVVEALSPFEDQGVYLAPAMTALDNEVPAAAHGLGLSRGMPVGRKSSGRLLAHVLRMSPGPGSVAGEGPRLPRGDFGGGVLAVSRRQNILSRS